MFTDVPVFLLLFDEYTSRNVYKNQKHIVIANCRICMDMYVTKLLFPCKLVSVCLWNVFNTWFCIYF